VYISNEIIDERKLSRLAELHERANVSLAVDSMLGLSRLADALRKRGSRKRLPVLIDVNVGHDRCGCSVDEAIVLAQAIVMGYCKDVIEFRGIHCYHGSVQHVRSAEERAESARKVSLLARQARDAMIAAVGSCNVVTGGGTGTFATDLECEVFTELQPGLQNLVFCGLCFVS
jgi:D-serine deaminase-like pyridoxal phosphate-dependent protein